MTAHSRDGDGAARPRWAVRRIKWNYSPHFWFIITTPPYHRGRGPYVSIGLGLFAIYRGY